MRIYRQLFMIFVLFISLLMVGILWGCGQSQESGTRDATAKVLSPEASGEDVLGNDKVAIDISNKEQGYVMVKYTGNSDNVRMQLSNEGDVVYDYFLYTNHDYEAFPFSDGDGRYRLGVYENIAGDQYLQIYNTEIDVALADEFLPFLYANQYVNFNKESKAVALGEELGVGDTDLDVVKNVYQYIVRHISYDYDAAENISPGYLPDVDAVLTKGKGICFDYAALTCAILRSQGIPSKLVVGYADDDYHAWISVYVVEKGWINNAIEFKGTEWVRMDPTFDANSDKVSQYIGNGSDYHPMYYY